MVSGRAVWLFLTVVFFFGCTSEKQVSTIETSEQPVVEQRAITAIEVGQTADTVEVDIICNRSTTYTSVKQAFPLGVAVYLPDTVIPENIENARTPGVGDLNSITAIYADKQRKTAKVEILLKENLDYEVIDDTTRLTVIFHKKRELATESDEAALVKPEPRDSSPIVIPPGQAVLTGISFNAAEDGTSDILVKTSQPVNYDLEKGESGELRLRLHDTDIPEYRRRSLVTTYFKSAVERIVPVQRPKGEAASTIKVKMREQVPYRIVQGMDGISLTFEPSTLEPPEFDLAKKKAVSGTVVEQVTESGGEDEESPEQVAAKDENAIFEKKVYTGEKIRLDFFETDIKNVFRILRSVSGMNFAVDKDVTGSVTMTLDKPVPWDQVLDLVLKMNSLGQIQEGSIVRIATLETMAREQKLKQDAMAAYKAAREQKKSLEPLMTEYIPINYSNADADVRPHLEKIITPDRGVLSVDERTNMIILTDTREKVDHAKTLIYRLDKVTPQIMISARVVEVNKNFSKSMGINWRASSDDVFRDDLGGAYGFNAAMNYPVASQGSIGFDFSRITGTPLELNATLTASEIKGDIKIISSPKILALDNKKAKITQGIEIAYLERDDAGGSSVKFKSIDLLLEVTPHVTPDQRIAMSVKIEKKDLADMVGGVPSFSTNTAETELLVNDGDTIVIGGVVKNSTSEGENGFPGLSNIPGFGRLFGSDINTEKKNELLIFITPSIVLLEQKKN
ncbi:MAG: type IV pilus secretin PilQ [Desulfobacteraceae bacterium]|nr:type IV pilus secretin PilQ [Desulfobacteraceae bacterium]